MFNTDELTHQQ
jgi:hypothetical protein